MHLTRNAVSHEAGRHGPQNLQGSLQPNRTSKRRLISKGHAPRYKPLHQRQFHGLSGVRSTANHPRLPEAPKISPSQPSQSHERRPRKSHRYRLDSNFRSDRPEGGISVYRPERFVLNHEHQALALSLDALVAVLFSVVAAAPNPEGSAVDLYLTMVLVAALSQPGSPEEKRQKARQALLRAVCEHFLPRTAVDGTPFGGLCHLDDLIVFPHPGASPPNPPLPGPSV